MTPVIYDPWAQKIRLALLELPGAQVCLVGRSQYYAGCQVITQGGREGLIQHRRVVHPGQNWVK